MEKAFFNHEIAYTFVPACGPDTGKVIHGTTSYACEEPEIDNDTIMRTVRWSVQRRCEREKIAAYTSSYQAKVTAVQVLTPEEFATL